MHLFDHFQPAWTARTPRPNGSSDPHRSQHATASGLRGWAQLCPETSESAPRPAGRPAAKRADHPPPTAAPSALALWRPCPAGNQGEGAGGRDAATTSRSAPRGPGPIPPAPCRTLPMAFLHWQAIRARAARAAKTRAAGPRRRPPAPPRARAACRGARPCLPAPAP